MGQVPPTSLTHTLMNGYHCSWPRWRNFCLRRCKRAVMYPDMEAELYWEYKQLIDMTASDWRWLCLPWLSICFSHLVPTKEQSWCSMRRSSMPCKGCSLDRNLWREVWTPACSFFSLASPSLSLPWSWCAIQPRCETVSQCTSMLVRMCLLKYG